MKTKLATLIFAAYVGLPTVSVSQNECSQLAAIISEAPQRFQKFQGPANPNDPTEYPAKWKLPNATECFVDHDEGDDSYGCIWEYPNESSVAAALKSMDSAVGACLPSSSVRRRPSDIIFSVSRSNGYSVTVRVHTHKFRSGKCRLRLSVNRISNEVP